MEFFRVIEIYGELLLEKVLYVLGNYLFWKYYILMYFDRKIILFVLLWWYFNFYLNKCEVMLC